MLKKKDQCNLKRIANWKQIVNKPWGKPKMEWFNDFRDFLQEKRLMIKKMFEIKKKAKKIVELVNIIIEF